MGAGRQGRLTVKHLSSETQENSTETGWAMWFLVLAFLVWPLGSPMLQRIAKVTGTRDGLRAWIPLVHLNLVFDIAEVRFARRAVFFLIPLAAPFVWWGAWYDICVTMRKPKWLAWLMLVPGVDIAAASYIAYSKRTVTHTWEPFDPRASSR